MPLEGKGIFQLLIVFQAEHSDPESTEEIIAVVLFRLPTSMLLIDLAAASLLLYFLLLRQDVNNLTGTLGNVH